jgi:hypothetical protein
MNIYLIEDNPTKAAHLPQFQEQASGDLQIPFQVPDGWTSPVIASQNANAIYAALRDPHGLILLDLVMDDEPFKEAAAALLSLHCAAKGLYLKHYNDTFQGNEGFKLAAAILAVGETLKSRILICTSAFGELDKKVWLRLNQQPPAPSIEWPTDDKKFKWPAEPDMQQLREITEKHFRADYDKAAAAWDALNKAASAELFPVRPPPNNPHNVPYHLDPTRIDKSSKTAETLLEAFFNAAKVPKPRLLSDQMLYATKGAAGHNQLSASCVCAVLGIACKDIVASCMLNGSSAGRSPGAVLLALNRFATSPAGQEVRYTWNVKVSKQPLLLSCEITATGTCGSEHAANEMKRKLSRTPAEQMKEDPRPTPGTSTLALDYLDKRIDVEGANVKFTFRFQMSKLP